MKYRLKKNTAAEDAYVQDLERRRPLEMLSQGKARLLPVHEYPEPIKRFLARERRMVHVRLSPAARKRLETLSRSTGLAVDELARRWVEERIEREAG